jgi:NADH:ubiquinone oxidoreductase subunit 3 (subunit A)
MQEQGRKQEREGGCVMAGRQKKRSATRALVLALLFIAVTVALIVFIPRAIDSSHATQVPTPGQVILPPTAPAATAVATSTSK